MTARGGLPPLLAEIAEVAGASAAYVLGRKYACRARMIPQVSRLHDRHWLVLDVGWDAARAIADRFSPDTLEFPAFMISEARRRRRAIAEMADDGASRRDIARRLGLDRRTVQRTLRRGASAPDLPLFDPPKGD